MRLTYETRPSCTVRMMLLSPVERLAQAPWYAKLVGVLAAVVEFVAGDPFTQLMLLYGGICLFDLLLGSEVAHKEDRWNGHAFRAGAVGKVAGLMLVMVIRALEAVIANAQLVDTHCAISFGLAIILIVVELESFDRHKEALTGRPTPFIRPALSMLRSLGQGTLPKVTPEDR